MTTSTTPTTNTKPTRYGTILADPPWQQYQQGGAISTIRS